MNILLPTDFSGNSRNAINYALNLFKNQECTFYFLHAFPRTIYSYEKQVETGMFGGSLVKEETQKKTTLLSKFIASFKEHFNTENQKVYSIVTRDFITDAIKDTIKDKKIDVIVVGAKGETSSNNVVFGSVTSYVLTKLKTPTLTIPSNYKFAAVKKILFPSDYLAKHTIKVLQPLVKISSIEKSEVSLIHCTTKGLNEKQEENKKNLNELLNGINLSEKIVENDDFIAAVEEKMENFDMLFMVNNKKSFFENLFFTPTVSKVVVSLKKPFLVSHFSNKKALVNWTKNELKAYTFIYLMNADLEELTSEIAFIKEKVGEQTYKKVHLEFAEDNDYQAIQKIKKAHKELGYSKEEDSIFFNEMKELFTEDENVHPIEEGLLAGLKRILKN